MEKHVRTLLDTTSKHFARPLRFLFQKCSFPKHAREVVQLQRDLRVLGINVLTETLAYPPPDVWIHGADPVSRMAQSCCALGLGPQNPGQESPQFT